MTTTRTRTRRRLAGLTLAATFALTGVSSVAEAKKKDTHWKNTSVVEQVDANEATDDADDVGGGGVDVTDPTDGITSLTEVVEQIGADDLWAAGYTGEGIDVAVIDTGVAPVAELSDTDVFVGPDLSFEGGVDELAGLDTYGHGTHMAGLIAGRTPGADPADPQPGEFLGVAPDAGIVSVKVADNTGAVDVSQVIAAIDWVVQHRNSGDLNIRVLNLSYNTDSDQHYVDDPLSKAVENAWNHGIVVVVSGGNEGKSVWNLASPATNPHVLAVSSAELSSSGKWEQPKWAPSGRLRKPDVVAPGVSIASLRVPGSRIDTEHPAGRIGSDDRLFLGSGTSQSAAVVSGAVALLLEQRPELSPDEVKGLLTDTALDIPKQKARFQGHGVIDLAAAMTSDAVAVVRDQAPATGLGSLEAARGGDHVVVGDSVITGEVAANGAVWDPVAWVEASESGSTWSGTDDWSGSTWSGSTWSGSTWSGSTWSGSTWSGSTWSGSTWSGSTWSGSTWSGSTWSGSTWSGSTWSGSTWSGSTWSGSTWSGSTWSSSTWS